MKDLGISKIKSFLDRSSAKESVELPTLGWREWVSLPEFNVSKIKAKVDSGARTSALHASDILYFRRAGKRMVRFKIYPEQRNQKKFRIVEAKLLESRPVRSSIGSTTIRPVIVTELKIGKQNWPIEITLVNRDLMGFRMLIGRQAIRKKFLIDPGKSYLIGKKKSRNILFPFSI